MFDSRIPDRYVDLSRCGEYHRHVELHELTALCACPMALSLATRSGKFGNVESACIQSVPRGLRHVVE